MMAEQQKEVIPSYIKQQTSIINQNSKTDLVKKQSP